MSFGDEIMASGHALVEWRAHGSPSNLKVAILGRGGKPRWSEMWEGLPWIYDPRGRVYGKDHVLTVVNGPQCRPYIAYPFTGVVQRWTSWRARDHIGRVHIPHKVTLSAAEAFGKRRERTVVIEPAVAAQGNPNKQWGIANWIQLTGGLRDLGWDVVTVGQRDPGIPGARWIHTPTFHHAVAVLNFADTRILPEGGLHHATAALRKHAIVLFGACLSEPTTGYDGHTNVVIRTEGSPCGAWRACAHCQESWKLLQPGMLIDLVQRTLEGEIIGSFSVDLPKRAGKGTLQI